MARPSLSGPGRPWNGGEWLQTLPSVRDWIISDDPLCPTRGLTQKKSRFAALTRLFIWLLGKASFARRQIKNPALRAGLFFRAQDWIISDDPLCPTGGLTKKKSRIAALTRLFYLVAWQSKLCSPPNKKSRTSCRTFFSCPGLDSNQHTSRRRHLKTVRLPISPPGLWGNGRQIYRKPGIHQIAAGFPGTWSQTATWKSRRASFRLVFRSVLGLRRPMISAQPTWYSPAGNRLG